MASFDDIAVKIASAGLPVLFLDTCILLDIIRLSTNEYISGQAEATINLLRLVSRPLPECLLVISSLIPKEWGDNIESVIEKANRYLKAIEEQSTNFHDVCRAVGIEVGAERTRYANMGLTEQLRSLSEQLLQGAHCLDPNPESRDFAFERVCKKVSPARTGGAQMMDCVIIEDYLAICRGIRRVGGDVRLVFCSSNTKDYCDPGKKLHPVLVPEFSEVGLVFKPNLPGTIHELTK